MLFDGILTVVELLARDFINKYYIPFREIKWYRNGILPSTIKKEWYDGVKKYLALVHGLTDKKSE